MAHCMQLPLAQMMIGKVLLVHVSLVSVSLTSKVPLSGPFSTLKLCSLLGRTVCSILVHGSPIEVVLSEVIDLIFGMTPIWGVIYQIKNFEISGPDI